MGRRLKLGNGYSPQKDQWDRQRLLAPSRSRCTKPGRLLHGGHTVFLVQAACSVGKRKRGLRHS